MKPKKREEKKNEIIAMCTNVLSLYNIDSTGTHFYYNIVMYLIRVAL